MIKIIKMQTCHMMTYLKYEEKNTNNGTKGVIQM